MENVMHKFNIESKNKKKEEDRDKSNVNNFQRYSHTDSPNKHELKGCHMV